MTSIRNISKVLLVLNIKKSFKPKGDSDEKENSNFLYSLLLVVCLSSCSTINRSNTKQSSVSNNSSNQSSFSSLMSQSNSTSNTSNNSTNISSSGEKQSEESSKADMKEKAINGIDTGQILLSNYDSLVGTWTNNNNESILFNSQGIASDGWFATNIDIDADGVLILTVTHGTDYNNFYIIPAGKKLNDSYFPEGYSDSSDASTDHIVSHLSMFDQMNQYSNIVYYHVSR